MSKISLIGALLILGSGSIAAAQQGTVTAVTLSPTAAEAGTTVTATVTGSSGVCGGVYINWGDGTEPATYPTSYLPVTKTHVYAAAGTYTVRAQGMGNCTGETSARIAIKGPAAPPAAAPEKPKIGGNITGVEVTPRSARTGEATSVKINGTGTCYVVVDFDDGKDRRILTHLPYTFTYTFAAARDHEIVVWTDEPCTGSGETIVRVRRR